ncbi:MAG: glycosyltransferase family 39 protein, partial [Bacteroidota bacterium]
LCIMNRIRPLYLLYVALGLTLLLRLVTLTAPFWNLDEAVSALIGDVITEGGLPYRDGVDHRGPLTYYIYAAVFEIAGEINMSLVHLLYIGVAMGLVWAVYLLGKQTADEWAGGVGALIIAIYSWAYHPADVWAAHTEWIMSLCTAWAMWGLWTGKQVLRTYIWVGLLLGLAILSKQVALWECGVVAIWLGQAIYRKQQGWRSASIHAVVAGGMTCVPLLLFSYYFYQKGIWSDWIAYGWQYNLEHYIPIMTWGDRFTGLLRLLGDFLWDKPLIWMGMGLFLRQYLAAPSRDYFSLSLLSWAILSFLGAAMSGRAFGHYMIQVLVPWTLLAGIGWVHLRTVRVRRVAWIGILLVLLLPTVLRMYRIEWPQTYQISPLAAYLNTHSQEDDRLFIWGMYPELYVEADRKPASRFIYCNMISGMIPWENLDGRRALQGQYPGAVDSLLKDLEQHPPLWIVDTTPDSTFAYHHFPLSKHPRLYEWVHTHYLLDSVSLGRFEGFNFHLYQKIIADYQQIMVNS